MLRVNRKQKRSNSRLGREKTPQTAGLARIRKILILGGSCGSLSCHKLVCRDAPADLINTNAIEIVFCLGWEQPAPDRSTDLIRRRDAETAEMVDRSDYASALAAFRGQRPQRAVRISIEKDWGRTRADLFRVTNSAPYVKRIPGSIQLPLSQLLGCGVLRGQGAPLYGRAAATRIR